MPVFLFSQDRYAYHRVYVATDKDCVNVVFKGKPVAGPAFAPRLLPTSELKKGGPAQLDLWDSSLPSGRYYWTVVPVDRTPDGTFSDAKIPQDVCQDPSGRRPLVPQGQPHARRRERHRAVPERAAPLVGERRDRVLRSPARDVDAREQRGGLRRRVEP